MTENTQSTVSVTGAEFISVPFEAPSPPDMSRVIEEERVRDALLAASDVLRCLAETISQNDQVNDPDTDRSHGRVAVDVLDLVSD